MSCLSPLSVDDSSMPVIVIRPRPNDETNKIPPSPVGRRQWHKMEGDGCPDQIAVDSLQVQTAMAHLLSMVTCGPLVGGRRKEGTCTRALCVHLSTPEAAEKSMEGAMEAVGCSTEDAESGKQDAGCRMQDGNYSGV